MFTSLNQPWPAPPCPPRNKNAGSGSENRSRPESVCARVKLHRRQQSRGGGGGGEWDAHTALSPGRYSGRGLFASPRQKWKKSRRNRVSSGTASAAPFENRAAKRKTLRIIKMFATYPARCGGACTATDGRTARPKGQSTITHGRGPQAMHNCSFANWLQSPRRFIHP